MCKIPLHNYKQATQEILTKRYKTDEIGSQRKIFCTLINQYLSIQSQFNIEDEKIFENSLLEIFEDKIISFFQFYKFAQERSQPVVKIYTYDSILFNQYFKQSKNPKMKYLSRNLMFKQDFKILLGYSHPGTDLIQLIFNGKEVQMMLNINDIFNRTIFLRSQEEISTKDQTDSLCAIISHKETTDANLLYN